MEFNAIVITAFKCSVTEELREFNLKISKLPFAVYCGIIMHYLQRFLHAIL